MSAFCHLKNISSIKGKMSQQEKNKQKQINMFIFNRIDYWDDVFTGLTKKLT